MKSIKPILLVLAGVLITIAMVSFKNEEPKKEYLTIAVYMNKSQIIYPNGETKEASIKLTNIDTELNKQLNTLSKENWTLKSNTVAASVILFVLERTQQ